MQVNHFMQKLLIIAPSLYVAIGLVFYLLLDGFPLDLRLSDQLYQPPVGEGITTALTIIFLWLPLLFMRLVSPN